MLSPITQTEAQLEKTISSKEIIDGYYSKFGMDVSRFFKNTPEVALYRCEKTGFRFYRPEPLAGDSGFYEHLQEFWWYYMPWKWEHKTAFQFINNQDKVLEIGSGSGSFVEYLQQQSIDATGLELNTDMVAKAKEKKLPVLEESIEAHSESHSSHYNFICAFQVLEHISNPRTFLTAAISALKPKGLLFISVPNNDGINGKDNNNYLNMPPHHMGLWNEESLTKTGEILGLKPLKFIREPLQKYHAKWYYGLWCQRIELRSALLGKICRNSLLKRVATKIITLIRIFINGHTIAVIYEKS